MNLRNLGTVLAGSILVVACGGSSDSDPLAANVRASLSRSRVPLGSPVEITYEFQVLEGARLAQDYRVFSHFVDADDELMWTDDHYPPKPTSQWKPGETVKYSRLRFMPVYPYVGQASLKVGLYGSDGQRVRLGGTEAGQRAYRVAAFEVAPQTENIYVTFRDGWHLAEMAGDNAGNEWHWTRKDATLSFRNPRRDIVLFLDVDGRTSLLPEPQVVTVSAGGQPVGSFSLGPAQDIKQLRVAADKLGVDGKVELTLSVDRTFVPEVVTSGAQKDTRELGIRVFHAFVEAR